jgi:hypothetical protein
MPLTGVSPPVGELLRHTARERSVVSLYLWVPKDPEGLRGLPIRASELLSLATASPDQPAAAAGETGPGAAPAEGRPATFGGNGGAARGGPGRVRDEDQRTIRDLLEQHSRDWLGHTVAMFVSGELRWSQAFPVPCGLPDRAVVATRPHVRPLLVANQRCPRTLVVIIDRRHAGVFRLNGEIIETVAESTTEGVRSPRFGGWWGLESYRIHERINQLTHHHFRDTATLLAREVRAGGNELVVLGGHEETTRQFMAALSQPVRAQVAGSFAADPATLTPARLRSLAAPVIADWVRDREERLLAQVRDAPPDGTVAVGLAACLEAVKLRAVQQLVLPVGGLVPGFMCADCGALSSDGSGCPHGPSLARPVPDLLEEMAVATIADGGTVEAVHDPPAEVMARLRFPLAPHGA